MSAGADLAESKCSESGPAGEAPSEAREGYARRLMPPSLHQPLETRACPPARPAGSPSVPQGPETPGPQPSCPHQLCDLWLRASVLGTRAHPAGGWEQSRGRRARGRDSATAPRLPGTGKLTLTTGGVGGTTGMMGVAGGGGAAAGGTGTDVTFAVMVGTGVAAMTGVWETVGGTLWKAGAGHTEDTAATCCEP